jgi:hypothetical protein
VNSLCTLCSKTAAREDCYVRIECEERPTCRPCWEQLLLDPRRLLREMRDSGARPGFLDSLSS